MPTGVICPTYGFILPGGAESRGGKGSKLRIEHVTELIRTEKIACDCVLPFPQKGRPKLGSRDHELLGDIPLGQNVVDWAKTFDEFALAEFLPSEETEGTWADTIRSLEILAGQFRNDPEPVDVHFVSDPLHLVRIWFAWRAFLLSHPKYEYRWRAHFHATTSSYRSLRDFVWHEPTRIAWSFLLYLEAISEASRP